MRFFDCNCSFGQNARPAFRYARDAGELLQEMDFCGIDQALVYPAGARFGSPSDWNTRLLEDIRRTPRLSPTCTILPSQTDEMMQPEDLLTHLRGKGIRALRAFPQEHRYRVDKRTFGDLCELLTERRIPLFVKENLLALGELLKDFPDLTVVAVNQGPHSLERYLRPMIEAYPNLHIETSYYIIEGAIEEFCARYGAERILFGTGFPDNCRGGAVLQLLHADIPESARQAIAADNLRRLLGEANP